MTPSDTRLAAFDLDGTLLNSIPSIVIGVRSCWSSGFLKYRMIKSVILLGYLGRRVFKCLFPALARKKSEMIHEYHAEIARGDRSPPPRPPEEIFVGAVEMLDRFEADGYELAIVTSRSNRRFYEFIGAGRHISGRFTVKTADLGPGKPSPFL